MNTTMENEEIKERVRQRYAAAVTKPEEAGCCAKKSEPLEREAPPRVKGARTSFGCGDPLAVAPLAPGDVVVDIGSGPGADALAAARAVGPRGRVFGIDMTPAMLETARKAAREAGAVNVEFLQGDAEGIPLPDASADWVISNCVINLVPDKDAAFREMYRVLKPGGRFSISDLIGENLPPGILADRERYCSCIGGAPSLEAYLGSIRSAGFQEVSIEDRFEWPAPELEGTGGRVWSLRIAGRRPAGSQG